MKLLTHPPHYLHPTLTQVTYISKIYNLMPFQNTEASDANIAPMSHICTSALQTLVVLEIKKLTQLEWPQISY
jgi:hypothetical protein